MTKKECFIKLVEEIFNRPDIYAESYPDIYDDAATYFEVLKGGNDKEKPAFTENGKLILQYLQKNKDSYNNLFKAKDVGEGLNISSRTASGAMRKLVSDNYVEKVGENPVIYAITDKGMTVNFADEQN